MFLWNEESKLRCQYVGAASNDNNGITGCPVDLFVDNFLKFKGITYFQSSLIEKRVTSRLKENPSSYQWLQIVERDANILLIID